MTILTSLKVVLISSKKVREQMSEEDLRFTTRAILTQIKIQDLDVPDVQPGFRKEKPEIKLPTSAGSFKKQEFHKNIYFCFTDYAKAFDCGPHQTLENSYRDGNTRPPNRRNRYTGQEANS